MLTKRFYLEYLPEMSFRFILNTMLVKEMQDKLTFPPFVPSLFNILGFRTRHQ